MARKVIGMEPGSEDAYIALGRICADQGDYGTVRDVLANELSRRSGMAQARRAYERLLAVGALEPGAGAARSPSPVASVLSGADTDFRYSERTKDNYRKLRRMLQERGIAYVCMQYPVRSLRPLREIFGDGNGIIFVDNEEVFKDALRKDGYKALFTDRFAFDFGHCTARGNALLGGNAADAILKAVFHRKDGKSA